MATHYTAHYLERHLLVVLLTPVDELALEVPFSLSHLVDIDICAQQFVDDNLAGKTVATLQIYGAYQGLEGIAANRLEGPLGTALVLYELNHAYLARQLPEALAAHYLGPHLGEETLPLEGVFLVQVLRHNRAQYGVAEVFQALVVGAVAFGHSRHRTVYERRMVQLGAPGCETQHVLEETVEFGPFLLLGKQQHGSVFSESKTDVMAAKTESIA